MQGTIRVRLMPKKSGSTTGCCKVGGVMAAPVPEKERRGGWMVTYRAFCWSVIRALKRRLGDSACPEGRIGTAGFEIQRPPCGAVVLSALTRTTNRIGAH